MKIFLLILCLTVAVSAQTNKDLSDTERTLYAGLLYIENAPTSCKLSSKVVEDACTIETKQLGQVFGQIVRYPELVKRLAGDAAHIQLEAGKDKAEVRLTSILIAQNQRIIELLETIAKKPR